MIVSDYFPGFVLVIVDLAIMIIHFIITTSSPPIIY